MRTGTQAGNGADVESQCVVPRHLAQCARYMPEARTRNTAAGKDVVSTPRVRASGAAPRLPQCAGTGLPGRWRLLTLSIGVAITAGGGGWRNSYIGHFNNTLRQHTANLVRKTLSFRTDEVMHRARICLFIDHYNRRLERFGCLGSI